MTRVIKIGGRPQTDPRLPGLVARAAGAGEGNGLVIVHGGGDEVSMLQKTFGSEARFVDGRRVTSAADMDILRMALSGSANKRLVSELVRHGVAAIGISGEDAALIESRVMDAERMGHVGTPERINVRLIWHMLDGGYLPVVSPVSRNSSNTLGVALNVNGDEAAAALAVALAADELLLVADVQGVMANEVVLPELTAEAARALMDDGTATGGMHVKLFAALDALDGGVERVRIGDIEAIADMTRGTVLRRSEVLA